MTVRRFSAEHFEHSDLIVDAVYEGGRSGNAGDDPLPALLGVSNQGGFRYLGTLQKPSLVVLTSSFNDPDWPDNLDRETGILTYFGDNKHPGRGLHETPRHGNELLRDMFNALHANPSSRDQIPPVLVFGNAGSYRDMTFLGLAVPGAGELTAMEDLTAVWKIAGGQRFQNYRAALTVLDVAQIKRDWLQDIKAGLSLSERCPVAWKDWVVRGNYRSLRAEKSLEHRSKAQQIPDNTQSLKIVRSIYEYFKEAPVQFEACAAAIVQLMVSNVFSLDLTRPSRDGGRDAIGLYRIGDGPSAIFVEFALEAKCYDINNAVGVREVSRLISRLRHRQFGILVTTSYLHSQAYKELKEDRHPVIVIAANDIVSILSKAGISSAADADDWLRSNFPRSE